LVFGFWVLVFGAWLLVHYPFTLHQNSGMALKIFRAVWFLSVLAVLARLLFGYAGWQEELVIQEKEGEQLLVNKEALFYVLTAMIVLINVVVYIFRKLFERNEQLRTWIHILITSINIFFIVAISLVGVYNSFEKFNYQSIEFIIYGSVGLIICVALAWPVYAFWQKFFVKQAV
jgi:hypothetical protein